MVPRSAPPDRLAKLLEVAAATFVEHGFHRTQMDDIAARLSVSKGTIYRSVESKEALFGAVIVWGDTPDALPTSGALVAGDLAALSAAVAGELATAVAALELNQVASSPKRRRTVDVGAEVERLALDLYATMARHRTKVMVLDRCAAEIPELADVWYGQGRYTLVDLWTTYLEHRVASVRTAVDPAVLARTIVEVITTWAVKMHWDPAPRPYPADTAEQCATMVRNLVTGAAR